MKLKVAYKGPRYADPQIIIELDGSPDLVDEARLVLLNHYLNKKWREK